MPNHFRGVFQTPYQPCFGHIISRHIFRLLKATFYCSLLRRCLMTFRALLILSSLRKPEEGSRSTFWVMESWHLCPRHAFSGVWRVLRVILHQFNLHRGHQILYPQVRFKSISGFEEQLEMTIWQWPMSKNTINRRLTPVVL